MRKRVSEFKIIEVPEKGGITIPDELLRKFGFKGMKLVLLKTHDCITLKKLYLSSKKELADAIEDVRIFARGKGITKTAVARAIKAVKKQNRC